MPRGMCNRDCCPTSQAVLFFVRNFEKDHMFFDLNGLEIWCLAWPGRDSPNPPSLPE